MGDHSRARAHAMAMITFLRAPVHRVLALALLPVTLACSQTASQRPTVWTTPPQGLNNVTSGAPAERFFPLIDGHVFHYLTMNEMGEQGILVARVRRQAPHQGELMFPRGTKRFQYTDQGIVLVDLGTFVLKQPFILGTSWRGEHGGQSRITAIDASIEVLAGRFTGCLQTLEERLGDHPARYVTTFCPDVGVVLLEASGQASYEKAELKSYGPTMDLGPDGVRRSYVTPSPEVNPAAPNQP